MENFRKLGLSEPVLKAIEDEKFEKPSEVQEKAIPLALEGKDVIAGSATGSGKTLAFAAGIIQMVQRGKGIQAFVLTPTRELAEQVTKTIVKFSRYAPLKCIAVYGGVAIDPQIRMLETADVVVGTPGRLLDHLERRTIRLDKVKILVLDEADKMFDMGFVEDVERILQVCPAQRQTLLFSATISEAVVSLAQRHMNNPIQVVVESFVDPKKLTQAYYDVADNLKFSLLVHLLRHEDAKLVMVFCNTKRNTDMVAKNLKHAGIDALAIHGGFSQAKRNRALSQFHAKSVQVLVCTDVAARGLDVEGISHVYNYDIPKDSKQYIHRIGRTARAGKEGKAINIVASRDYDNFSRVLRDNDLDILKETTPYVERVQVFVSRDRDGPGGSWGGRGRDDRRDGRGYSSGGSSRDRDRRWNSDERDTSYYTDTPPRQSSQRHSRESGSSSGASSRHSQQQGQRSRPHYR